MGNMLDELTFGEYISVKRQRAGLSKKEMAKRIVLSDTYYSNIENGVRPAPAKKIQKEIVKILGLSEAEAFHLYDLAAKTKKHRTLPVDICEYIASDENIKLFLRKAKERDLSGTELLELL